MSALPQNKPEMHMQSQRICDEPDEAVKLTPERQSPPVNGRACISPFTFSRRVQSADMGSASPFTPSFPFKNHARQGNCSFLL